MNKPVLMRVSDDAVVDNMAHKSYSLAIVLLSQMQRETGVLSKINQFRLCQCLYFTRRYVAALEKAKQFIAAGNTMPEMYFLRGMCHFQMGQWTLAIEMFKRKKREWHRWLRKAEVKRDSTGDRPIIIGEMPTKADDEKATFEFQDDKATVKLQIPLAGIDPNELKVHVNDYWLELVYDDGHRKFTKSVELFDKVIPKSVKVDVTVKGVSLELTKAKEAPWPSLNWTSDSVIEKNFDVVLEKMNLVQEFTDEEAAELFEDLIPQLKEEAPNISGWFDSL